MQPAAALRTPLLVVLPVVFIPVLFHLAIVETRRFDLSPGWSFDGVFRLGFVTAAALTHWSIYASLIVTFGLTLRPGREPIITALARKMHGRLDPELAAYTRRVTIAWCGFFMAQLTMSVALFCFAPLVIWSFFVNILDLPLVILMFSSEYVFRIHYLRNPPRDSLGAIFRMVADAGNFASDAARPE